MSNKLFENFGSNPNIDLISELEILQKDNNTKLSIINELNFKFSNLELNYIEDSSWSYYNSIFEDKQIKFQENSFQLEKNYNSKIIIVKFKKKDFYIFFNFMLYFFSQFFDSTININSKYSYNNSWDTTCDMWSCEIEEAFTNNKFFFKNIYSQLNEDSNVITMSFDNEESGNAAMSLVFVNSSLADLKKFNGNWADYFSHISKKYVKI